MRRAINLTFPAAAFILISFSLGFSQTSGEDNSINIHYPQPYASYKELRAKKMSIGDNYYNNSQYCWSGACANKFDPNTDLAVEGNVGIGTISPNPGARLDVRNHKKAEGGVVAFFGSTDMNPTALAIGLLGSSSGVQAGKEGISLDVLELDVSDERPLVLQRSSGKVGIGTVNPQAKLDVAGDVKIAGVLSASPRIYLIEENKQETLSATSWTDYMKQTITVGKDNSNVLFIFSFSQPHETGYPSAAWRAAVDSTYSNPKYIKFASTSWNVLPGGFSFLVNVAKAGTYIARLQYKFYSGNWEMSAFGQPDSYNSLIIIVL